MSTLAIDQGTTSTRALIKDGAGNSEIICVFEQQQNYPQPGWVEHDPEELIRHIRQCIDLGLAQHPDITAIGIDNQGESCLAWDVDSKRAISPVIVWQDSRTQPLIEQLKEDGMQETILEITGLPLDAYFSASKLGWILNNIPEAKTLHQRGKLCLGTTDAFFLHRLTGRFVSDISTASRTSLMELDSGQWSPDMCQLFGVPIDALPKIVPTTGDFGMVNSGSSHIPVTASVVDQQASLVGHGCRNAGDTKITFGTGAFALVLTGKEPFRSPEHGLLPTVAWQRQDQPPIYALDGAVYCAGSAINWAKSLGLFHSFDQINQFSKPAAIVRDLVFVPALSGLACPHWDRRASGLWIGLTLDTTPMDMMQSILEGIAFRAAEVIMAMDQFTRIADTISIDGGVSSNPYFCQFLANLLERKITVQKFAELTALGTAALAAGEIGNNNARNQTESLYEPNKDIRQFTDKFTQGINRATNWLSKSE